MKEYQLPFRSLSDTYYSWYWFLCFSFCLLQILLRFFFSPLFHPDTQETFVRPGFLSRVQQSRWAAEIPSVPSGAAFPSGIVDALQMSPPALRGTGWSRQGQRSVTREHTHEEKNQSRPAKINKGGGIMKRQKCWKLKCRQYLQASATAVNKHFLGISLSSSPASDASHCLCSFLLYSKIHKPHNNR